LYNSLVCFADYGGARYSSRTDRRRKPEQSSISVERDRSFSRVLFRFSSASASFQKKSTAHDLRDFSKPIGRGEFIVGKYLGLCLTLAVNVLIMGVGVSLRFSTSAAAVWLSLDLGRDFFNLSRTDDFNRRGDSFFSFSSPALSPC
jgi:hypothetical protein